MTWYRPYLNKIESLMFNRVRQNPAADRELVKRQLAAVSLLLDDMQLFMNDLHFLFVEIDAIEHRYGQELQTRFSEFRTQNSAWSSEEAWNHFAKVKANAIIFIKANRAKNTAYQCLSILVSNWLKAKSKTYCKIIVRLSGDSHEVVFKRLMELGNYHNKKPWAWSVIKASDFVRHRDEWQYNSLTYDPKNKKVKSRKQILSTMKLGKSKRTAQFLIELGIKETSLFGFSGDACTQIFERIDSSSQQSLEANCRAWLTELKSHSETEVAKLLN